MSERRGGIRRRGVFESAATRLRRYVQRGPPSECWPWTGTLNTYGYGVFGVRGRQVHATRALWELVHGPIQSGYFICHRCDNPPCMNMLHLFLGTPADNARDRNEKGRTRYAVGSACKVAKLSEAVVLAIRAAHASGAAQQVLAARHGISKATMHSLIHRRTWRHVQ